MDSSEKEQRRKKIKALEAALFGAENEWISAEKTTDLPQLKNVNEYASRLETVETRKGTQPLTRLKTAAGRKKSSIFLNLKKKPSFDSIALINDQDTDEAEEENFQNFPKLDTKRPMSKTQR